MMKKLGQSVFAALTAYAGSALALWAEFGPQLTIPGLKAAGDLTAHQYRVMRGAGANLVNACSETAVTSLGAQQAIGVLQNNPNTDEAATVAYAGVSKAVAGAAVTANLMVTHNASAQVINAVSGAVVIGRALEAAGAAGDKITVLLFPPVRWGAIL